MAASVTSFFSATKPQREQYHQWHTFFVKLWLICFIAAPSAP
jgi:hypothetical protein